jgi:hypothetical protein
MGYFRVTYDGYYDGEHENEDEAKQAFINYVENNETDGYGRTWDDLISVEKLED